MGELADKLAKGASELRFLLTQHKVADDIQGELYENGLDTVAKFAAAASDEADLKKMLKDSFSIDPTESLKLRTQAAGVVVAWKTAISRAERQAEAEATHEVRDIAKPIPSTDYISMRQAFAAKFGELEDKHIPAKEFIEKKLGELESGEFRAEPLTEIISRDEVDPDTLLPHWDAKGTHSPQERVALRPLCPPGPEQLRLRLTVLQNTLSHDSAKAPWAQGARGRELRAIREVQGVPLGRLLLWPTLQRGLWLASATLEPGAQLRARYQEACLQGHGYCSYSFGAALVHAYKEPSVKERNFTTPLALHAKRPQPWNANTEQPPTKKGRKGAKGNGKGQRWQRR